MRDNIGIVVRNHDKKILFVEGDYFIKSRVNENQEVKEVIAQELKKYIGIDVFKIRKIFTEELIYMKETLTMYLVEVGVYHNELNFVNTQQMLEDIMNFNAKDYFKRHILKYEDYSTTVSSIYNMIMVILIIDIFPSFKILLPTDSIDFFWSGILVFVGLYFIFAKIIRDRITNRIIKYNINTRSINLVSNMIIIIYCVKFIMNIR